MSTLYKQTTLLTSRRYYHGGSGLEDNGLRFFRSMDEYTALAKEHGWQDGVSFKSGWCTKPVPVLALVKGRRLAKFMNEGRELLMNDVFIMSSLATQVHQIGAWQT
jgi:hypothetical protein